MFGTEIDTGYRKRDLATRKRWTAPIRELEDLANLSWQPAT